MVNIALQLEFVRNGRVVERFCALKGSSYPRYFPFLRQSWLRDLDTLGCNQPNAAVSTGGDLVDVETSTILFRSVGGTQRRRRRGAQNDIATGPDPIRMPMAVENEDTRGIWRDRRQNVRSIDQGETDAVAQTDRSHWILHDLMVKQNHPGATRRISQHRFKRAEL